MPAALLLLITALLAPACAGAPAVVDASPGLGIAVDGAYEDWQGRFTRIDPRRSVGLGVTRDGGSLYLGLVTRDLPVQTLLRRAGFTLWIDPAGGSRTKLGIRVAPMGREGGAVENGGDGADPPERGEAQTPRIEIVRDGAEYGYQLADTGADHPVEARTALRADVLVYEFRLALDTPLTGVGGDAAATAIPVSARLGIGVVTEPFAFPDPPAGAPRPPEIAPLAVWVVAP